LSGQNNKYGHDDFDPVSRAISRRRKEETNACSPHRKLTLLALGLATLALPARAEFPDKPVRIVVPYSAGGGTDIVARRLAERLTPRLKQPVVVDNRPGANGIIGTDFVAKSAPDGHTYVLVVNTHLLNPILYKKMPYDTFTDLIGVTMVCKSPLVLSRRPRSPLPMRWSSPNTSRRNRTSTRTAVPRT
jgi:tripartite-type tricarboxylate transporter receptor subunit TctC